MPFTIHNWKLTLLGLIFTALFASLGFWQLSRAHQKQALLAEFQERTERTPATAADLTTPGDWRFFRVSLEGQFDDAHTLLMDNKIVNGKVGYEVYTPFKPTQLETTFLVDRGFIPTGTDRAVLPAIPPTSRTASVMGMLNLPPAFFSYGAIREPGPLNWPLRLEYLHLPEIAKILNVQLFPYILSIDPQSPNALDIQWQILTMGPEKHQAYAVQWFALSLTLLILSVALNRTAGKTSRKR